MLQQKKCLMSDVIMSDLLRAYSLLLTASSLPDFPPGSLSKSRGMLHPKKSDILHQTSDIFVNFASQITG